MNTIGVNFRYKCWFRVYIPQSKSFKMIQPQIYRGPVFMLDGWELHSYVLAHIEGTLVYERTSHLSNIKVLEQYVAQRLIFQLIWLHN
jgi:hypothetical protein